MSDSHDKTQPCCRSSSGELASFTDHNSKTVSYARNPNTDALQRTTLPNGMEVFRQYDELGRLSYLANRRSPTDIVTSFAYQYAATCNCSTQTLISRINFENGRYVKYDYDNLARLVKEEYFNPQGVRTNAFQYEYDNDGNRLEKKFDENANKAIWYASDTGATQKQTAGFGASNQLKKMWTGSGKTTGNKTNVAGRVSDTTGGSGIQSVVVTNTPPAPAPPVSVTAELRDTIYVGRGLELQAGNNNLSVTATDKAGKQKQYPEPPATHTAKLQNTLDDTNGRATYAYDLAGNMTSKATRKQGLDETTTYTYDYENQLTQITFPGSPSRRLKFYYDGFGRRVQMEYYKQGSPDPVLISRQKFVYLGGSVIRELNDAGATVREYIRDGGLGGGIGSIIYCKEGTNYYYFHYNHKGDVVSVTDGNKTEVAYYEYDAWGNIMTEAGTWSSPYCFATKERDYGIKDGAYEYKSGLIYFGARYYSPEIGRWTQRDPAGDGLNLYLYANNGPTFRVDPWGLVDGSYSWDWGRGAPPARPPRVVTPDMACKAFCLLRELGADAYIPPGTDYRFQNRVSDVWVDDSDYGFNYRCPALGPPRAGTVGIVDRNPNNTNIVELADTILHEAIEIYSNPYRLGLSEQGLVQFTRRLLTTKIKLRHTRKDGECCEPSDGRKYQLTELGRVFWVCRMLGCKAASEAKPETVIPGHWGQ